MANDPLPIVQAFRTRVSLLSAAGAPIAGASNSYVSDALVVCTIDHNYKNGTVISQEGGGGQECVHYEAPDTFIDVGWEITLCTPDPLLMQILAGLPTLTVGTGPTLRYGQQAPAKGLVNPTNISIEMFGKRIDATGELDGAYPYGWLVLPRARKMRLGKLTLGNNAVLPIISGRAIENPLYGNGPFNDWLVASDRTWQWIPATSGQLPATDVAYITVPAQT